MSIRTILCVAGLIAIVAPLADAPPAVRAQASAAVPVMVGVRAAFVPEGDLADPSAVTSQHERIHRTVEDVMTRAASAGIEIGERFETIPYFTARLDAAGLAALAAMPEVAGVYPDRPEPPQLFITIPLIGAAAAHAAGVTGAGWKIAVLDTGVEATSTNFQDRLVDEACFSNGGGEGVSLCPNGGTGQTGPGSGIPCTRQPPPVFVLSGCGHGNIVAGIAAGVFLSGRRGVAPAAGIIAIQIFTRFQTGCPTGHAYCIYSYPSDQMRALERVLAIAGPGNVNRIAAVNLSVGAGAYRDPALCDEDHAPRKAVIDNLRSIGIATVAASGNGDPDNPDASRGVVAAPACVSSAVSVGASGTAAAVLPSFHRAWFLSLMAPGRDVVFDLAGAGDTTLAGTSWAAPYVSGAWALLKQVEPAASVSRLRSVLRSTGAVIPDVTPCPIAPNCPSLTHWRLNVNDARLALGGHRGTSVPGEPQNFGAAVSGSTVTFTWTAPVHGGIETGGHQLTARTPATGDTIATLFVPRSASTSTIVRGVPNGLYYLTVKASNVAGFGPESLPVTVRVGGSMVPGAPRNLAVAVSGSTAVFSWLPPVGGDPPAGYTLEASLSPSGLVSARLPIGAVTTATVPNIPFGTYYVRLIASNPAGTGPASNQIVVSVAPPPVPGAPALAPAVVSGSSVTLSWTPGAGGPPASYLITASFSPAGAVIATLPVNAPTLTLTVPAPRGTYYVRITAVNLGGPGPASNEIQVIVP